MERELIEALLSGRRITKPAQVVSNYALIRGENGLERLPLKSLKSGVGAFEGKQGTLRRSRKGRTYRAPNGQRYFAPSWDKPEVVAYLP